MSIVIDTANLKKEKSDCHLVPVNIKYDGPAKVSSYFKSNINDQNKNLTSSFRGKPLVGKSVKIPENFIGIVGSSKEDEEKKVVKAKSTFDSITYWKWDQQPNERDHLQQSLNWLEISEAIHQ